MKTLTNFKITSKLTSIFAISMGALVLFGWAFNIESFKSILPIWASMKPNTALAFILAGISLWFQQESIPQNFLKWFGRLVGGLVFLIGVLTLIEYLCSVDFGIDQLLFKDLNSESFPGRMAPVTAINFILCGAALFLLDNRRAIICQILAILLFCFSWVSINGYFYGVQSLYQVAPYVSIAFHTALTFLVLSLGIFFVKPTLGLMAHLTDAGLGGIMLRRLLPSILCLMIVLGWIQLMGQRAGYYDTNFGIALLTLMSSIVIITLVWRNSNLISNLDKKRTEAERKLVSANKELEKRVEERSRQLSRLNEEFRAVVETAQDAIVSADQAGIICYWNHHAEKMFGYPATEIIGQPLTAIMPERFRKAHSSGIERVIATGVSTLAGKILELTGLKKSGQEFPIDISLASRKKDDVIFFTAIIRDISDRKRLEAQYLQSQKMESVGKLAGGIAHDFNNLLTVINGYAGMGLQTLTANDPVRNDLEEILKAGKRAQSLTTQLLGFSRRQMMRPAIVRLNEVITGLDKMINRLIGETIAIEMFLSSDLGNVKVDAHQIEQVLVNLLVNARDAMPQGGKITIKTENIILDDKFIEKVSDVEPGEYALVAISDIGMGMTDEVKKHIFEPFYTTKEKGKGSGLGLATSFGVIKQNKGHIAFESKEGKGTSFQVYLPIVREKVARSAKEVVSVPEKGSETILVVEDEPLVRELAVRILKIQGYRIFEAANGSDALKFVESNPTMEFHLILTDVIMPIMGGKELAEKIKKIRPVIKIVFMSGYTDSAIDQQGKLNPDINFVQKPFMPTELANMVRKVLDENP